MARRKYSRGRRRMTQWADLIIENVGKDTGGGILGQATLFEPSGEQDSVTLLRIVGNVGTAIQTTQPDMQAVHWMLYKVSNSALADLDPSSASDVSTEDILHWQNVYHYAADASGGQLHKRDTEVDVRVKRKFHLGDRLIWVGKAQVPWHYIINFRGLFAIG